MDTTVKSSLIRDRVCFLVDDFLTAEECRALVSEATRRGFGPTGADYPEGYRNNDRLVMDDPKLAARHFESLQRVLPVSLTHEGASWRLVGLNERFRFCRYRGGQGFTIHRDGAWSPAGDETSLLTVQVYLDDAAGFVGGRTRFFEDVTGARSLGAVTPRAGRAIVFEHALWHDGEPVTAGTKHVMRTDVMYRRVGAAERAGHTGYVWSLLALEAGRLASGSRDRTIRIHDAHGCVEAVLEGHTGSVTCLASDARARLWSGSRDHTVRSWSGGLSTVRARRAATVLALTGWGDAMVVGDAAGELTRISTETASWRAHDGWVTALVTIQGNRLVSGGTDGRVAWWTRSHELGGEAALGASVLSLSACEEGLVAGLSNGEVVLLTARLEEAGRWRAHEAPVTSVLSLGPRRFATASEDSIVKVWGCERLIVALPHRDFVRALAPLSGGGFASAGYDGEVRRYADPFAGLDARTRLNADGT